MITALIVLGIVFVVTCIVWGTVTLCAYDISEWEWPWQTIHRWGEPSRQRKETAHLKEKIGTFRVVEFRKKESGKKYYVLQQVRHTDEIYKWYYLSHYGGWYEDKDYNKEFNTAEAAQEYANNMVHKEVVGEFKP